MACHQQGPVCTVPMDCYIVLPFLSSVHAKLGVHLWIVCPTTGGTCDLVCWHGPRAIACFQDVGPADAFHHTWHRPEVS